MYYSNILSLIAASITDSQNRTKSKVNDKGLGISPAEINEDYRKKWNIYMDDFVSLTLNGELLRPTLYRVGGMGKPNLATDKYFVLLKHTEAFYGKDILKMSGNKNPKHLNGTWCIIDQYGNEKFESKSSSDYLYLLKNSCICSSNQKYYNIETGELYCDSSKSMESEEYLFLDNAYDKDESKRGIMMINKCDGTWDLFSKK